MFFMNVFSRIFVITVTLTSLFTLSDTNHRYVYGYDLEDDDSELIIPSFMFDLEPRASEEDVAPAVAIESGASEVLPELESRPAILPEAPKTLFSWSKTTTPPIHLSNPIHAEKPKNLTEILAKNIMKIQPSNPAIHAHTTLTEMPEPTISEYTSPPEKTSFLSNSWRIFIGFIESVWTSISGLFL